MILVNRFKPPTFLHKAVVIQQEIYIFLEGRSLNHLILKIIDIVTDLWLPWES